LATKPSISPQGRHLQSLRVQNFKSIADSGTLPFAALTVLAGANSSGKSSLLQPLLLLKQTVEASRLSSRLKLDGPNVLFDEPSEFLCRPLGAKQTRWVGLEVRCEDGFGYASRHELEGKRELALRESKFIAPSHETVVRDDLTEDALNSLAQSLRPRGGLGETIVPAVIQFRGMLLLGFADKSRSPDVGEGPLAQYVWLDIASAERVRLLLNSFTHLSCLRNNPARTYRASPRGEEASGPFEDRMASVIAEWVD